MIDNKKVTGIILVAGNSVRYGQNRNKNFEKVKDKYIFQYSLEKFIANQYIDDVIIALKEKEKEFIKNAISMMDLNKKVSLVIGGDTRKKSVYNCLNETDADIVIIHDGARPLVQTNNINKCIESMKEYKGVSIAVKSKDTIKITDNEGIVTQTTPRKNTWIVQTPQCFDRNTLKLAHEKCENEDSITDDCMLLENEGIKIKLLEGTYSNIKLTNIEDLEIIKSQL